MYLRKHKSFKTFHTFQSGLFKCGYHIWLVCAKPVLLNSLTVNWASKWSKFIIKFTWSRNDEGTGSILKVKRIRDLLMKILIQMEDFLNKLEALKLSRLRSYLFILKSISGWDNRVWGFDFNSSDMGNHLVFYSKKRNLCFYDLKWFE